MADEKATFDELVRRRRRKPFVPFTIVLRDGSRCDVVEDLSIAITEDSAVVFPPHQASHKFKLSEVIAIEPDPEQTAGMNQVPHGLPTELQRKLLAKPFVPFAVETSDGRHLRLVRKFQAAMNDRIFLYMSPDEREHLVIKLSDIKSILAA